MALTVRRYNDLAGPYLHYGGRARIWFSKSGWKYFIDTPDGLQPLSGVTSICHVAGGPPDALIRWAVKQSIQRTRDLMGGHKRRDGFYEVYDVDFEKILTEANTADKDALDLASSIGHIAHAHIEAFIKAKISGDESRACELLAKLPEDERAANCFIAFIFWMAQHNVRLLHTERRVLSLSHGYAGTCDADGLIDSCDDPSCCSTFFRDQLSVIDHKTSNALRIPYALQTAAYQKASEEEFGMKYEARWVLRYGKDDAEFDPWYFPGRELFEQHFEAFEHALSMHRIVDSIEKHVSEINEQRKALVKAKRLEEKLAAMKIRCPKADEYLGKRMSKCLPDGAQCEACTKIRAAYLEKR